MTEIRPDVPQGAELLPDGERDLQALRDATARDLPSLERSMVLARSRREAAEHRKERWMSMMKPMRRNPWLATAAGVAVVVAALLVVPVSYEKTSRHDVTLTLNQPGGLEQVEAIAGELETALGVEGVRVSAEVENGAPVFTLEASVPGNRGEARAQAFGQALIERGFDVSWTATPRTERVWGSVYAYARDRVIRVSVDGKSAQQLQDEIRRRLAEAGITHTQVSVTDVGGGRQDIRVKAEVERRPGEPEPEEMDLQLTRNGQPIMGEAGCQVQVKRLKDAAGAERMVVEVAFGGRSTSVEIADPGSKGDAALAAEINAGLARAGLLDVVAEVSGGEITVRKR